MEEETVRNNKRFSAYLIDILLVFFITMLISEVRFINPNYDKYNDAYEKYSQTYNDYIDNKISIEEFNKLNENNYYYLSKYGVSYNIVTALVIILYFGVFQKYNKGQTIGKKIFKIKVVSNDDKEVSLGKYLLRLIPMYYIYIGGLIPIIIDIVLIYILKVKYYMIVTSIITYVFVAIALISVCLMVFSKNKKGLHELLTNTKVVYEK